MKRLVCMLGPAVPAAVMLAPVRHCGVSHRVAHLLWCPSEDCHTSVRRFTLVTSMSCTQLQNPSPSQQLLHALQVIAWVQQHAQTAVLLMSACMMWFRHVQAGWSGTLGPRPVCWLACPQLPGCFRQHHQHHRCGMAESSADGVCQSRRSSMHLWLPWGGSASGLPTEQHAGWGPDWLLQCLL